ncbi:MAG: hypothetical protein A2Y66_01775 [Nitrospirae bacterium RBG_13_41_22]|nr:MAG: hypothetical protein A2Y66_01775 [Nitrospirae bacterium RBG_13_41_22]
MEHWQILKITNEYAHISSPSLILNDRKVFENFKEKKELRQGLKDLEEHLKNLGIKKWVSWTLTSRPHIMRLFSKIGAKPYNIQTDKDSAKDMIWFKKEI